MKTKASIRRANKSKSTNLETCKKPTLHEGSPSGLKRVDSSFAETRRNFLKVSASVPAFAMLNRSFAKALTPTVIQDEVPDQNLLVGFVAPADVDRGREQLHGLLSSPDTKNTSVIAARSAETAKPIKVSDLGPGGQFELGSVKDAERIEVGDQSWLNDGIMVQFIGVFTAGWQWNSGDQGSFTMNLKFKEVPESCPKLSKASMGSDFKAIKNGIIPAFENFYLTNGVKVDVENPLRMSFNFVDVADETDKSLVLRIFDVVKKLPSVGGVLEGPAAPYITAGTAILEVLGQNLLSSPKNQLIWSDKVALEFRPGTQGVNKRLKQGYYIIAGNKKGGGNPDWSQYQLRAADPNNSGLRRFLYERIAGSDKITPVTFSYVLAYIDRKQA